jgi:hypothetical protein
MSSVMLEQLERQARLTVNQRKIMIAAILGDMLDFSAGWSPRAWYVAIHTMY